MIANSHEEILKYYKSELTYLRLHRGGRDQQLISRLIAISDRHSYLAEGCGGKRQVSKACRRRSQLFSNRVGRRDGHPQHGYRST